MHRTLNRYVISECLPTLGLTLGAATFVLIAHRLFMLSDMVVEKGVPALDVAKLLLLALPPLAPILLPVGLLLAVLLAMGRLSTDNEIVAMRACGIGLGDNLRPIMVLSTAVFLVSMTISLWGQPLATREFRVTLYDTVKNRIALSVESRVFAKLASGINFYAEETGEDGDSLKGLFIHMKSGPANDTWIFAEEGSMAQEVGGLILNLSRGEMHTGIRGGGYRRLRFNDFRLAVPLPQTAPGKNVSETTTRDLYRLGYDEGEREARLELNRRIALPFSCLIFGVLGATLGLHHSRTNKSMSMILCVVVLIVYYSLLTSGNTMGKKGTLPAELAMWLPNIGLGALAIYAYLRKNREAPLPLEQQLANALRWLAGLARFWRAT